MAQACPGITRRQLQQIAIWHFREETFALALARLVEAQHAAPFSIIFGSRTAARNRGRSGSHRELPAEEASGVRVREPASRAGALRNVRLQVRQIARPQARQRHRRLRATPLSLVERSKEDEGPWFLPQGRGRSAAAAELSNSPDNSIAITGANLTAVWAPSHALVDSGLTWNDLWRLRS
jgi:hypothetical protein